jgi:hypothetical protein
VRAAKNSYELQLRELQNFKNKLRLNELQSLYSAGELRGKFEIF